MSNSGGCFVNLLLLLLSLAKSSPIGRASHAVSILLTLPTACLGAVCV